MPTVEEYQRREELYGKAFTKIKSVMKDLGIDCKLTIVYEGANPTYVTLDIKSNRDGVPDVYETYYVED
nr:MAG TPA: hypothetical protein [Caudoviricetes sp.]